jgi:hypothetical protein
VEILVGTEVVGTVVADSNGDFSIDITLEGGQTAIFARATDPAGNVGDPGDTVEIILDAVAPTASAGDDIAEVEGIEVTLDGSGSSDNEGIDTYTWTFVLDSVDVTLEGETTAYTFPDPVTLTITLTVTDLAGNTATDTLEAVIRSENAPPTLRLDHLGPAKGNTQTKFEFSVTFRDADGDTGEVWLVLDGETFPMLPDPDDTDTTDGQVFTYSTKLNQGPHTYYYTGKDSFGNDAEGSSAGDGNSKSTPDVAKRKVEESPGLGAALMMVATIVAALILVGARRRRID